MQTPGYTTLTRMSGLAREMQVIANNVANAGTTGFRAEGLIFSEYVRDLDGESLSMAAARVPQTRHVQGELSGTGGVFDLAIEGDGFFLVETATGPRLTRAGAFTTGADGTLQTMDGLPVLDIGEAPVVLPPGLGDVAIAQDGTLSSGGEPLGRLAVVAPPDPLFLKREGALLFEAPGGYEPVLEPRVRQGFLEQSNVDPVAQISRMVEVQRAYELGQSFLDAENDRVKSAVETLSR
ncbi:flagellar hook-basal body complex protein [Litorisediminicola beolgyonensis]|uniref:Flagellar hook-basal body complex protein n=1 Tax=Litorisediminicola beolgyonensis TaxID=1173614 RepID=A0ABW3ZGB9_9RHOB